MSQPISRKLGLAVTATVLLGLTIASPAWAWSKSVTGRFAAYADPDGSGRVVCANYRGTAQLGTGSSGWLLSGRTRTYQGFFPTCPNDLPQGSGAMKVRTRAFRWNTATNSSELYYMSPLAGNTPFASFVDIADTNPYKPRGTYQFYSSHDWQAWDNYAHHYAFINEVGWTYYCNPFVGHSC